MDNANKLIFVKNERFNIVFGLYKQGNQPSNGIGVGIGMALCKKIVDMHRGSIWIDLDYKDGCRICFTVGK